MIIKYCAWFLLLVAVVSGQGVLDWAIQQGDVDWERCTFAVADGEPEALAADVVREIFGWSREYGPLRAWRVDMAQRPMAEGSTVTFHLALTRPIAIGSLRVGNAQVSYWSGDAWQTPTVSPNQRTPLIPLPPGTTSEQIRLVVRVARSGRISEPGLAIYRERLANLTPMAIANAEAEHTVRPRMGPPFTLSAANLVRGRGIWQNVGPEEGEDRVKTRPPVSDVAPSWLILSWPEPVLLHGLLLEGNIGTLEVHRYEGPEHLNPTVADERQWRKVWFAIQTQDRDRDGLRLRLTFEEDVTSRGLRIRMLRTNDGPIARVSNLQLVQKLGDKAPPQMQLATPELPPFQLHYETPEAGVMTMVIDGPDGQPVRNLIARRERAGGANSERWDLKSDTGAYVVPGTYSYRAIWHPGLRMHYEMTPFPNISEHAPENAPWLTGQSGTGGWLADHTPPRAVTTLGDRVYIGSGTAEGGVALLEADLKGRKLWGHHNFMAWTGPHRMAAIDGQLFVHAHNGGTDYLWQVDLAKRQTTEIFAAPAMAQRGRGIQGIAAIGDHLYLSVASQSSGWLVNAFGASDVDLGSSWPKYRPPDDRDQYKPNLQDDFLRLFRLKGTPAGQHGTITTLSTGQGPESRQHLVLAMNRAVPIGSIVLPMPAPPKTAVYFSFLKDDAAWPPNPDRETDWQRLEEPIEPGWTVVAAPPGLHTRALRLTFHKGGDEELAGLFDDLQDAPGAAWSGQIEGMKILRRRYAPAPKPAIRVNSGTVDADGSWDARRREPLSPENPGIYVMEWPDAQPIRGLAIKEIDGQETLIDVFTGDGSIDPESDEGWEEVATYRQALRYYYQPSPERNNQAIYVDGYVDFGREIETRAVRLRVISQWTERAEGRAGQYGVRDDRGGMDMNPARCRIYGVLAMRYLGGEPPVDALVSERLEVFDWKQRKIIRELPFTKGGDLYAGADGQLYALAGGEVVRVDTASGEKSVLVNDLLRPRALALDKAGRFYVFDADRERQVVRVYGADGSWQRDIGMAGGFVAGAWEPRRMGNVVDLAVDEADQLWVVEQQHYPKRVTRWSIDGEFLAEYFDRTIYGGGGVLDPQDKALLYYGPLEFELEWQTGRTRLKNLTYTGKADPAEQPMYVDGRKYLVTRQRFFGQEIGIVYRYDNGVATPAAAIGKADKFPPLKTREVLALTKGQPLANLQFVWSDTNGDGAVQPDEITFSPRTIRQVSNFDQQLGLTSGNLYWEAVEFLPSGVPVYEERQLPLSPAGQYYRLQDGNFFSFGEAAVYTPEGRRLWHYPTEGTGVHAYYRARPLTPEQVVAEFSIVGHGNMTVGDLGEYLVTTSNSGIWHLWTSDGLLASNIFLDLRHPRAQRWNMSEHDRNMHLVNLTSGQEHFWGDVTQTADGNVYGIWMSTNVFRIDGMDAFQRINATFEVTEEDIQASLAWEQQQRADEVYAEAKLHLWAETPRAIRIDGRDDDWEGIAQHALMGDDRHRNAWFRAAYDDQKLYLLYETTGLGPLLNVGEDWRRLFKSGGAVDLMLGTNPEAPANRKGAVAGDLRLLITHYRGKPAAVLYEAVVPDLAKEDEQIFETQVFRTAFSRVRLLDNVELAVRTTENGYVVEAAIPLATLGLAPAQGKTVKMDWGVLRTGTEGRDVLGRHYWSNQATAILSDIAAEAQLTPALWGHVRFLGKAGTRSLEQMMPGAKPSDPLIDQLLRDLD